VCQGVNTKSLERSQEHENGCPSVIEGEWEVNPEFVIDVGATVMLLDDIVDVRHSGRDEESQNECGEIPLSTPEVDVDAIQSGQDGETPANTINDCLFAIIGELVYDEAKKEQMNQRPDAKSIGRWCEIGLLARSIDTLRSRDGVYIATQKEEINDDVHSLEEDIIFP